MVSNGIVYPNPPAYQADSTTSIRELLQEEGETDITAAKFWARRNKVNEEYKSIRATYIDRCQKWDACNSRALLQLRNTFQAGLFSLVSQISNAHEVYLKLRANYSPVPHKEAYIRCNKFLDMRYKGGSAAEFVYTFRDAIRDFNQSAGLSSLPLMVEFCSFKRAVVENSRCMSLFQNLTISKQDKQFMERVYVEFIEVETNDRSFKTTSFAVNPTSANNPSNTRFNNKKGRKSYV
jgi:hypothetical protein